MMMKLCGSPSIFQNKGYMDIITNNWIILLFAMVIIYKWMKSKKIKAMMPALIQQGAILIDVRSQREFFSANAPGTINLPLPQMNNRLSEIPKNVPIVLCCASGTRSAMAKLLLKKNGYHPVYNIGSWIKLL